mgnify:CR=1 FL=1
MGSTLAYARGIPQDQARDYQTLNLTRSFAYGAELGIAPHALHGVLARVAIAAVNLKRFLAPDFVFSFGIFHSFFGDRPSD